MKNFADKLEVAAVTPESSYVEVSGCEKRMVVKKTSLCWLLRSDHVKLSSDRLKRVQAERNTNRNSTKRTKKATMPKNLQKNLFKKNLKKNKPPTNLESKKTEINIQIISVS